MKSTKLSTLLLVTASTSVGSFFIVRLLVSNGNPLPVSPINLLITLVAIGLVILALGFPIWNYKNSVKKSSATKRVDPFYAVRVLLLAKASSIAGSIFLGWHIGAVITQWISLVTVAGALVQNIAGLIASFTLVVASVITENICRLPDDSDSTDQVVST
jgi:membrane protease YdiL (CAAX protease family)